MRWFLGLTDWTREKKQRLSLPLWEALERTGWVKMKLLGLLHRKQFRNIRWENDLFSEISKEPNLPMKMDLTCLMRLQTLKYGSGIQF